ncbi:MAG: hypothetical protein ACRD2R_08430 [Terriglobales bacterium]
MEVEVVARAAFQPSPQSPSSAPRIQWSAWSRCESSFSLLLVPARPGVFALAQQVLGDGGSAARPMLAVFHVAEAEDLSRATSRLFAADHPLRQRLVSARCFVRYAILPEAAQRRSVAVALEKWLSTASDSAAALAEGWFPGAPRAAAPPDSANNHQTGKGILPAPLPEGF